MNLRCTQCGAQNPEAARYCRRCGHRFVGRRANLSPFLVMLKERKRFARTWTIADESELFRLSYDGYGFGYETISIDGVEYARRRGWGQMSRRFEFTYSNHEVAVTVAIPWSFVTLLLRGLSYVQVQIDGHVMYQEGKPPARPLPITRGMALKAGKRFLIGIL